MNELLIILALSCPQIKMINKTVYPWNENDHVVLDSSLKSCAKFYTRSPCLKIFTKIDKQDYRVICGMKE